MLILIQFDDGMTRWPDTSGELGTSSASKPDLVLGMLAALEVHEGHTVLEIGTGTGYNAALLAARLGAPHVTTVEIDPGLATAARAALDASGFPVTVVTGDGALGYPDRAPYDRVIATAAVRSVSFRQHGPRRLWDEVEAAFRCWAAAGKPPLDRSQTTVTPDRQTVS